MAQVDNVDSTVFTLYLSRMDEGYQCVTVANPTETDICLGKYMITTQEYKSDTWYTFPSRYIIPSGGQVTLWCCPGSQSFNPSRLHMEETPYLFWTCGKTLRKKQFFKPGKETRAILLNPQYHEVATIYKSSKHYIKTVTPVSDDVTENATYIFSRYKSEFKTLRKSRSFVLLIIPVLEILRVISGTYITNLSGTEAPALEIAAVLAISFCCDMLVRSLCQYCCTTRGGSVLGIVARVSIVIDMYWASCLYWTLDRFYAAKTPLFIIIWAIEACGTWLRICATLFKSNPSGVKLQRFYLQHPVIVSVCSLSKEIMMYVYLVLPFLKLKHKDDQQQFEIAVGYVIHVLFVLLLAHLSLWILHAVSDFTAIFINDVALESRCTTHGKLTSSSFAATIPPKQLSS